MHRISLFIILSMYLIIICFCISRCGNGKEYANNNENQTSISNFEDSNSTMAGDSVVGEVNDNINYDKYIDKIWVVESWTGGAYDYPSFYISKIQNGEVEGRYSTGSVAQPDFYIYYFEPSKYLGDLTGTINNGIVEAEFSDNVGNKGNLVITFKEDERIEVNIQYAEKEENYKEIELDGYFIFKPFNLKDIHDFEKIEEHSFSVDMDNWGKVKLISGEINTGDIIHPVVYLVNENDDILYVFDAPFKTGTRISDVSIEDINNDGLNDVTIITKFLEDDEIKPIKWVFLQKEDGTFYDSSLSNKASN